MRILKAILQTLCQFLLTILFLAFLFFIFWIWHLATQSAVIGWIVTSVIILAAFGGLTYLNYKFPWK